jgi:hypothetical protein
MRRKHNHETVDSSRVKRQITDRVQLVAFVALWAMAVGAGLVILLRYSNTPGGAASPPSRLPDSTAISNAKGRYTLLAFAHPQCPCTASSVEELSRIMAATNNQVDAYLFFYAPEAKPSEWVHASLWRDASIIPGVHVIDDREGTEARRFKVTTSGQTLLYDRSGLLQFSGGITASRGHSGGNDGRDAIVSLVLNGYARRMTTPVFGCSLLGENTSLEETRGY